MLGIPSEESYAANGGENRQQVGLRPSPATTGRSSTTARQPAVLRREAFAAAAGAVTALPYSPLSSPPSSPQSTSPQPSPASTLLSRRRSSQHFSEVDHAADVVHVLPVPPQLPTGTASAIQKAIDSQDARGMSETGTSKSGLQRQCPAQGEHHRKPNATEVRLKEIEEIVERQQLVPRGFEQELQAMVEEERYAQVEAEAEKEVATQRCQEARSAAIEAATRVRRVQAMRSERAHAEAIEELRARSRSLVVELQQIQLQESDAGSEVRELRAQTQEEVQLQGTACQQHRNLRNRLEYTRPEITELCSESAQSSIRAEEELLALEATAARHTSFGAALRGLVEAGARDHANGQKEPGGWLGPSLTCTRLAWLPCVVFRAWAGLQPRRRHLELVDALEDNIFRQGSVIARAKSTRLAILQVSLRTRLGDPAWV